MQYLTGEAEQEAARWMQYAAVVALRAHCQKAKCGTVIVHDGVVIGEGFNAPPLNDPAHSMCAAPRGNGEPKYDQTCCMHAEWRAILDAVRRNPTRVPGSSLYFVRVDDQGVTKPSRRPYCTVCSRMALDVGIRYFLLQLVDGIGEYPTDEYNRLSYAYTPEPQGSN